MFAFKNRLGWLIVGRKFTVFVLLYFVWQFPNLVPRFLSHPLRRVGRREPWERGWQGPSTSPRAAYIRRGDFTDVFLVTSLGRLYLEGLIFGILRYVIDSYLSIYADDHQMYVIAGDLATSNNNLIRDGNKPSDW